MVTSLMANREHSRTQQLQQYQSIIALLAKIYKAEQLHLLISDKE